MTDLTPEQALAIAKARKMAQSNRQAPPIGGAYSRPRFATFEQLRGAGDAALTLGSGALGRVAGGVAAFPVVGEDPEAAANIYDKVSSGLTRAPTTPEGQELIGGLSSIGETIDTASTDLFGKVPGGPVAQTLARTAVEGPLEILGIKGLSKAVRPGSVGPSVGTQIRRSAPPTSAAGKILKEIPEVDDLFNAGRDSYTSARQLGAELQPDSPKRLTTAISSLKDDSGLKTIVNDKLHPQSYALREEVLATLEGPVHFDDLLLLRQLARDASGTPDPSDARIALKIKNEIENYMSSLSADDLKGGAPQTAVAALKEGTELWRRARNSQKIEELIELARNDSSQYTGSGFENALTKHFRQLSRRIIKGQEKSFNAQEAAAIKAIGAGGDTITKALRFAGKLAPTGVVSGAIGSGAGFAVGGPAGAVALPAIGLAGRHFATQRGLNSVTAIDEALRGGLLGKSPAIR